MSISGSNRLGVDADWSDGKTLYIKVHPVGCYPLLPSLKTRVGEVIAVVRCLCVVFFFYTFLFCLGLNNDSHWIFYKIGVLGLSSPKDWIWKMGDFKIGILGSTSLKRNKSLKIDLTFDV